MTVADMLAEWRKAKGYIQAEAAKQIGVSLSMYRAMESGVRLPRQPETVRRIAGALGTDTDTIDAACGRIPVDLAEHLAGNYPAIRRVRMLEGVD